MAKVKHLSTRQQKIINELFNEELDEQEILDKYKVNRTLYNKWLVDEAFGEHLDKRIAAAYRHSATYIARYASVAAVRLVQLTDSKNPETARKACLDIISMHPAIPVAATGHHHASAENPPQQLSAETAGRLLAILAEENATQ